MLFPKAVFCHYLVSPNFTAQLSFDHLLIMRRWG